MTEATLVADPAAGLLDIEALIKASREEAKPNLDDMLAWVRQWPPVMVQSALAYTEVYSVHDETQVRNIAVVRALIAFLNRCNECRDDVETAFRAAAHRERWRRR